MKSILITIIATLLWGSVIMQFAEEIGDAYEIGVLEYKPITSCDWNGVEGECE